VYVALFGATMYFASLETQLSSDIRSLEATVASLESDYYDAIQTFSAQDPFLLGYASPVGVRYVTGRASALSLAPVETSQ
jgi:hypothetical protein